jgi:hypothetical protein
VVCETALIAQLPFNAGVASFELDEFEPHPERNNRKATSATSA